MNEFFLYIIKVSAVQSVFFIFYFVILKKRTGVIHQRIFLITSMMFSFIIPFIRVTYPGNSINIPSGLLKFNETFNDYFTQNVNTAYDHPSGLSWLKFLYLIYFTGMVVCIYRFLASIISLFHIIRQGKVYRHDHFKLVFSDEDISPFSFFHFIMLNRNFYSDAELKNIIVHENVHIKQLHSADIILIEIIQVLTWFNPLLSHVKRSVKAIHEYIADRCVIESGTDPLEYQMLLIRQNFNHKTTNLTSHLNVSLIKKRIMMLSDYPKTMNRNRRYFLVIPLFAIMLMAFCYKNIVSPGQSQSENRPCISPVEKDKIKVTSGYGMRIHPIYKKEMMHEGIDLAAAEGTPVVATADGIIKEIVDENRDPKGYGKFIVIIHDQTYMTMYAQLSEVLVKEKQSVKKGEIIGRVGKSGLSTAPHLHYEVWKNNEKVNPADYFQ